MRRRSEAQRSRQCLRKRRQRESSPRSAVAPRAVVAARAIHRHRAGDDKFSVFLTRRMPLASPNWADVPRPFPPDEDQSALREWNPQNGGRGALTSQSSKSGLEQYRKDCATYYNKCKTRQFAPPCATPIQRHSEFPASEMRVGPRRQ